MTRPIQDPKDPYLVESRHSMRCLLSLAVHEAVKLALIDSAAPRVTCPACDGSAIDTSDEGYEGKCSTCLGSSTPGTVLGFWTDEQKAEMRRDIHAMPSEAMAEIDPAALAQNVACRLLGAGGWVVGGLYGGNATPREIFEASLERPDRSVIDEIAFDLGCGPPVGGMGDGRELREFTLCMRCQHVLVPEDEGACDCAVRGEEHAQVRVREIPSEEANDAR